MDNTIVDTLPVLNYEHANLHTTRFNKPDQIPGIFRYLPPLPGAINGIRTLSQYYDLYILSTAPWQNPSSWSDKINWLNEYFGDNANSPFYKKVILTHRKDLSKVAGAILLDDRPYHGAYDWQDSDMDTFWLQYGHDKRLIWSEQLVDFLIEVAQSQQQTTWERIISVNKNYQFTLHQADDTLKKESWE